jgi:hypothetical protein
MPVIRRVLPIAAIAPETSFLTIEEVAEKLRKNVNWVREKIRRRCPNPMPVHNSGRHLLFEWTAVVEWVRNSPRPVHAAHKRRKHAEKAA